MEYTEKKKKNIVRHKLPAFEVATNFVISLLHHKTHTWKLFSKVDRVWCIAVCMGLELMIKNHCFEESSVWYKRTFYTKHSPKKETTTPKANRIIIALLYSRKKRVCVSC